MASYNASRNYTREIQEAVDAGDYKKANELEHERNAKIEGEGLSYQKTQDFGSSYDREYMTNEELGKAYEKRKEAREGTGSSQGAHDYVESIRKQYGYSGGKYGNDYKPLEEEFSYGSAPQYTNKYTDKIAELRDAILNREGFSYDYNADPLYAQYAESYTRGGDRAMQDTLGQMAARTGGLASSYADTVGQQQYNNYMAALADKVPELQQLAYSMYQDEGDRQRMNLEMLRALENDDYEKYLTLLNQYNVDRAFDYGVFGDQRAYDYNKSIDQRNYDYQLARDAVNDYWTRTQWDYGVGRDTLADQNDAYDRLAKLITGYGYQPSDAELEAAGMAPSVYQALFSSWLDGGMMSGGSSGGGGGSRRRSGGSGSSGTDALFTDMMNSGNPRQYFLDHASEYGKKATSWDSYYKGRYNSWLQGQDLNNVYDLYDSSSSRGYGGGSDSNLRDSSVDRYSELMSREQWAQERARYLDSSTAQQRSWSGPGRYDSYSSYVDAFKKYANI